MKTFIITYDLDEEKKKTGGYARMYGALEALKAVKVAESTYSFRSALDSSTLMGIFKQVDAFDPNDRIFIGQISEFAVENTFSSREEILGFDPKEIQAIMKRLRDAKFIQ